MVIQDMDGAQSVPLQLFIDIINDGETKAFNVAASGYIRMEPIEVGQIWPSHGEKLKIPKVIRRANAKKPVKISLSRFEFMTDVMVPRGDWEDVKNGDKPLHIVGKISYDDVFGNPHHTWFHYAWNVTKDNGNWGMKLGGQTIAAQVTDQNTTTKASPKSKLRHHLDFRLRDASKPVGWVGEALPSCGSNVQGGNP
jgi:hypothetical protein